MLLVWLLVMASGATACQLLARYQRDADRVDAKTHQEQPSDAR
jgi:multicomponent Na+:H+ antiporter subunit G